MANGEERDLNRLLVRAMATILFAIAAAWVTYVSSITFGNKAAIVALAKDTANNHAAIEELKGHDLVYTEHLNRILLKLEKLCDAVPRAGCSHPAP